MKYHSEVQLKGIEHALRNGRGVHVMLASSGTWFSIESAKVVGDGVLLRCKLATGAWLIFALEDLAATQVMGGEPSVE